MKLPHHPLLKSVPMMASHEIDALALNIKEQGQLLSVVLLEGKIIDGRNRAEACYRNGMTPKTTHLTKHKGKDFVASMNYFRKHWSTGERAHFAALMSMESEEGRPSKDEKTTANAVVSQGEAAEMMGVSVDSVQRAKAKLKGKPKPKPQPDNGAEPADKNGNPIPEPALPWWNRLPEVDTMLTPLRSAQRAINKLSENDAFWRDVGVSTIKAEIKSLIHRIDAGAMAHVCPYCKGVKIDSCKQCRHTGLMSHFAWKNFVPEEMRK